MLKKFTQSYGTNMDLPRKNGFYSKYDVIKKEGEVALLRVMEHQTMYQRYVKYWVIDGEDKTYYQTKIDGLRAFNKLVKSKNLGPL